MTDTMTTPPASRELPLEPGGSVDIVLAASDLRIRGIDGDRVIVRTRDGGPLDGKVRIEAAPGIVRIRDGEGSVRLGPLVVHTRRSPDLDIDLPADRRDHPADGERRRRGRRDRRRQPVGVDVR